MMSKILKLLKCPSLEYVVSVLPYCMQKKQSFKKTSSRLESKTVEDKRKRSPYFTRKLSKNGNLSVNVF